LAEGVGVGVGAGVEELLSFSFNAFSIAA